jgi:acyl-[acyl-carrier-protein]-phospholipid O-acyltransferase/long-chain-fatty-acid--[acyl-carrier-protein] ligase
MSTADLIDLIATTPCKGSAPPPREGLRSRSFLALLVVQFCTALNDQTFRWLVVPIAKHLLDDEAAALSLGLAGFTLPFLLFATPAAYLGDRFSKGRVITACKLGEMAVFAFGLAAVYLQSPPLLFLAIAGTGAMAALFAPSKLGSLPELLRDSELSTANGLMGLLNLVPCALGFLLGNLLAPWVQPTAADVITLARLAPAIAVIATIAVIGWSASLFIRRMPSADPSRRWQWQFVAQTRQDLQVLTSQPLLLRTALGIVFFWMLASLAQINIDTFGIHDLGLNQADIGVLGMVLVLGVGVGSVLAGVLSGGRVELGLVPLGALGITVCSLALFWAGGLGDREPQLAFYFSCVALAGMGASAGFFDVPLEAFLQHRSPPERLGTVLAATNFLVFTGILLVAGAFYVLHDVWGLSAGTIFLLTGLSTVPVGLYITSQVPATLIRFLFWLFTKLVYRVRVIGRENVPLEGGVLLVPNHVTWVDGILLLIAAPRPIRFVGYADLVYNPWLNWLARIFEVIPIKANAGPKALLQSLKTARAALEAGQCVCIFAEGALTRTGHIHPFQGGFLKIVQGTGAPIVPVYLHGLWGSIFSYRGGKFFWKWPRKLPYPLSISFGRPISNVSRPDEVNLAVHELGADAVEQNQDRELLPGQLFLRACRRRKTAEKVADSTGASLVGGRLLAGTLALRRVLLRDVLQRDERFVGILLPPTVGCVSANTALTLAGRVTVNLNYTMSEADLRFCVQDAGVKHVLTSRKMLEKKPVDLGVDFVFLEDLKERVSGWDRFWAACAAYVEPLALLERRLGLTRVRPQDPITVIYTSGSTGEPKGVVLSHHNIAATIDCVDQVFQIDAHDVVLGVVPIFHSFGYLAALWLPCCLDPKVVLHTNPLDARQIGDLAAQHRATILFATPTFLRTYLKRCEKEQFQTLNLIIVGAEKLPLDLAEQFRDKFGVLPTEGYGATETTGPASVNVPDHRCDNVQQRGTKLGSVGRPLPGVAARAVDPETRAPLPPGAEGLIEIKGPNVMLGYLNRPEKTAEVIRDGWYNTGDMGFIDDEGFIHITGRISRFSKIGGEMVPHIKLEECLLKILDRPDDAEHGPLLCVTSVPDPKKGERIVVLHRPLPLPVPEVLNRLAQVGLPNLWLPSADSFCEVPEVPLLGTGKTDLKAVKKLALERFAAKA